ncbi:uncharacterized protein LOC113360570 [Papaver somniferum]|uniref:uncharacterized protein LOC113360570 n=1 Tax=Papaver somniferum TaxID=3469 RepID=UPI000E6F49A6|nr:uncharacterized protein LOC113360570 [Papaver somniferum]
MIPLGKGFFTIKLENMMDKNTIKFGQWEVSNQILRVRNWMPNFKPEYQRTSSTMVWVHYPGFSLEYWDEKTLFNISSVLGTPVKVDEVTLNYENGLYARVLVQIDLAKKIPSKIWIKTKYGGFMQNVLLTKLPKFCPNCKIVGHTQPECRAKNNTSQDTVGVQQAGSKKNPQNMEKFDIAPPQIKETVNSSTNEANSPIQDMENIAPPQIKKQLTVQ